MQDRVIFAPGVGSPHELGAEAPLDLFEPQRLATGARVQPVLESPLVREWRVPLPGTVDAQGRMLERPRGAGTGWLRVRVFTGRCMDVLRLRCTAPPSRSPAAREWNLLCHLASQGVAAPGVVALVEQAAGTYVQRSCLVTRELEGYAPAPEWIGGRAGGERRLGLTSAGHALVRLFRAGVWLPALRLDEILIEDRPGRVAAEVRSDDCAAETLLRLSAEGQAREGLAAGGLSVRRLPGVAVASVAGGRRTARMGTRRRRELLERLAREARARTDLTEQELLRAYLPELRDRCSEVRRVAHPEVV